MMKNVLLLLTLLLVSCSQADKSEKFLKQYNEFCFSLYDDFASLNFEDLKEPFSIKLSDSSDAKVSAFLKQHKNDFYRTRIKFLKSVSGTIPSNPSPEFEDHENSKELLLLFTGSAMSDSVDMILQNPIIQLKMLYPTTFHAYVSSMLMAQFYSPEEMGRKSFAMQMAGAQIISTRKQKDLWELFYNNGSVQLYTEYNPQTGKTTIKRFYTRKRKTS